MTTLTAELLRQVLAYDPQTGIFTQRIDRRGVRAGQRAGWQMLNGYVGIAVLGKQYYGHRLAWLYVRGTWPATQIDHRNRDRADNRFANLREATNGQNQMNIGKKPGTSQFKGVSWQAQIKRWQAHIQVDGRSIYLGVRKTEEEAHKLYVQSAQKYFGEFARFA